MRSSPCGLFLFRGDKHAFMLSKHRELQLSTKNAPSEKELQGGFSGIVTESNELQIEKQ